MCMSFFKGLLSLLEPIPFPSVVHLAWVCTWLLHLPWSSVRTGVLTPGDSPKVFIIFSEWSWRLTQPQIVVWVWDCGLPLREHEGCRPKWFFICCVQSSFAGSGPRTPSVAPEEGCGRWPVFSSNSSLGPLLLFSAPLNGAKTFSYSKSSILTMIGEIHCDLLERQRMHSRSSKYSLSIALTYLSSILGRKKSNWHFFSSYHVPGTLTNPSCAFFHLFFPQGLRCPIFYHPHFRD
jgi:hypothetical protein